MAWTADDLVADVRATGFLPDASDQSSADLLLFADKAMVSIVGARVKRQRAEHWYATEDTAITPGTVSYRKTRRAFGGALRAVTVVEPGGVEYTLDELDPVELRARFKSGDVSNPRWYAFEGDFIKLGAVAAASGWMLRQHYIRQPSRLMLLTTTASPRIVSAPTTLTLTLGDVAPDTSITTSGALVDIQHGQEPYDLLFLDRSVNTYSNPTLTFGATTPIVVADIPAWSDKPGREASYVVARDRCVLPQIPHTMWPALVEATVAQALSAVRDPQAGGMMARAIATLDDAASIMVPRDERNTRRIIGTTHLRRHGRYGAWR